MTRSALSKTGAVSLSLLYFVANCAIASAPRVEAVDERTAAIAALAIAEASAELAERSRLATSVPSAPPNLVGKMPVYSRLSLNPAIISAASNSPITAAVALLVTLTVKYLS